jgi:hypothetical protein
MNVILRKIFFIILILPLLFSACSKEQPVDDEETRIKETVVDIPDPGYNETPLDFKSIVGKWQLLYDGNYGYEFRFNSNYKSVVIVYAGYQVFVFKGVYNIEDDKRLKITIYEIKQDQNSPSLSLYSGFTKSKSSYFLINCTLREKGSARTLTIKPERIIIDGKASDGYFEPVMKLKKSG